MYYMIYYSAKYFTAVKLLGKKTQTNVDMKKRILKLSNLFTFRHGLISSFTPFFSFPQSLFSLSTEVREN